MQEVKICKKCGKKMIKRYRNEIYPTYPAQYPWYWWCKCGHTEEGGVERGLTEDEYYEKLWEEENAE